MSKTKSKGSSKPEPQTLTKVKGGAVTKLSQTPKAKSKELAKKVAAKEELKPKKKVKEPSPESSSSEEEESDESVPASEEDSEKEREASDKSESESESDSESEDEAPISKAKPATDGVAKAAPQEVSDSSSSSSSSDDEEAKPVIKNGVNRAVKKEDSDDSGDDSDESDESEEEKPKKKGPVHAPALKTALGAMADKKVDLHSQYIHSSVLT